jgi:D-alanine-D-alanine ligase
MGEDGTVQGMLELAGVPYVGAGVLSSALCMDKAVSKELLKAAGLPVVRSAALGPDKADQPDLDAVLEDLGLPLFVKPANLGSSVGVTKVTAAGDLAAAVSVARRYDDWVLIEEAIDGREIEVAVLGNEEPRASVPGEVKPSHDFYDFEDKYVDGTVELVVPAPLPEEQTERVRRLALAAYRALRVEGMARVDFFYDEAGRGFMVNEVNTIPGFTPGSMYPMLWESSGVAYAELIDELVRLALDRHNRRSRLETFR